MLVSIMGRAGDKTGVCGVIHLTPRYASPDRLTAFQSYWIHVLGVKLWPGAKQTSPQFCSVIQSRIALDQYHVKHCIQREMEGRRLGYVPSARLCPSRTNPI